MYLICDLYEQVTWRKASNGDMGLWKFYSVGDVFENGACFTQSKGGIVPKPNYNSEQNFKVADAKYVRAMTKSSGALSCKRNSILC